MRQFKSVILSTLLTLLFISNGVNAQSIGGPYASDENTMLLMHFDGNLTNSSTLSGDGTLQGSGASYSSYAPTNLQQCFNLDGSSYVTVPHSTNLDLTGDWTIEAWIKVTEFNSSTQSIIVRKPGDSDSYTSNYTLELHPWWGNILHGFYFSDAATRNQVTEFSPTLNQWYHVAFIRDAANSIISIIIHDENWDIVSSSNQTYSTSDVLLNSQDLRIGESYNGYIDELRISNVVRSFNAIPPPPFPEELDQVRIEKKINALNLHRMKYDNSPYRLTIDVLSSAEYEIQKPLDALPFDCGYVTDDGYVYVSEPTTAQQLDVFTDIDQAAIYYMCQSFLQYYYQATEMPIWFKTGFAAYESDMRFDDNDIKTAYNNYGGTLTSFDVLNNPITFAANNGLAISYMFGEFIGVFKVWGYDMVKEVNALTIIPESTWYNAGTIEDLFEYFMNRYFSARILETNELERLKLGQETEHFKHYYREAENYWLAYFPNILEEAITEYMGLMDFETFEKISALTMPICNYVTIGGGDCVNLRYTSGTAWSSGIWASSPDTDGANDIERFEHLIRHELAHLVQTHLPARNMTAWLNEGFAEFMSRGPSTQQEKEDLKSQTENTLNDAINYFGHLPTFEDTKVYPGQTNVDYYLLGQIMLNFIYENGGYSAVKEVMLNHETGIANMGYSSLDAFMASYYYYVDVEYLQKKESDYFSNYTAFITKLTNLTSSADSTAQLNTFWNNLIATKNFPFAIDTKVAFLYRGSASTVNWAGEFNGWDMNIDDGRRLGVSDVWILEKEFLADTRSEYKIVRNGSEWLADENNPNPLVGDFSNSELWMPDYSKHTELVSRLEIPKGVLSKNILKYSTSLGYTSQYRVYTPAGYNTLSNLPTIYVTDGQNYLDDSLGKMVIVLNNLIADGLIEPVIAIFLDPRDPDNLSIDRRGSEYRNNISFVNYITQELIPDIDANFKTNSSADARGIMGASYGGYNAAYFCVKAPSYFHNIGINSAYLHPEGSYNIDTDLQAANLDVFKLYLSYGTFDADGERYFDRLKNIFDQKGKEYEYTIVGDGHTWKNWSRVIADALVYFYVDTKNTPPTVSDIPDQTITAGSNFEVIQLDNYVTDPDNDDSQIEWSYSANVELSIEINSSRVATVSIPNDEWLGRETIVFTATDPDGNSKSDDVVFTVVNKYSNILALRENDTDGVPVLLDSIRTITGTVTASNHFGSFGPAFIQDNVAGVSLYGGNFVDNFSFGDSITVTGKVGFYNGLTQLKWDDVASSVTVHKNIPDPQPELMTIESVLNQSWDGLEIVEGKLVRINDVSFELAGSFAANTNYNISDGVNTLTTRIDNDVNLVNETIPIGKVDLVGCISQFKTSIPYDTGYLLYMRNLGDIKIKTGFQEIVEVPSNYSLSQNYPNPFNPSTMIQYGLPERSNVRIEVFNMLGQSAALLVDSEKSAGLFETIWDASNLPSGIYIISIKANGIDSEKNFVQVNKALLIK